MAREIANDTAEEELREFAEAGAATAAGADADPGFEEKLRRRLWRMLRARLGLSRDEREPLD